MTLSKDEARLLVIVYKASAEIEPFTVFRRSKINFADFTKNIQKLFSNEYLFNKGNGISITQKGIDLLLSKNEYLISKTKPWREVPKEYLDTKIIPDSLYIPSISRLDARHFVKK